MADSSSTALNRALDNIGKCKGPGDFREWAGKIRQAMSLYAREMLLILDGTACPNEQGEREGWQKTKSDLFSILFFATEGSAFVTVKEHEGQDNGRSGGRCCRLERPQGAFRRKHQRSPPCLSRQTVQQPHETR